MEGKKLFNMAVIGGNLAFGMGWWGVSQSASSSGNSVGNTVGNSACYHWLPLETIDLMDDNREFEVWGIFWALITIIGAW